MNIKICYGLLSLLIVSSISLAEDADVEAPSLVIGGVQHSSNSSYSYLGLIKPLWGGKVGDGWFNNTIASWLTYDYNGTQAGKTVNVKAQAPGIETGLGYAWKGPKYALSLSTTLGLRDIGLKPLLPTETGPEGMTYSISPQLQARYVLLPQVDTDLISSYSFGPESSFNRLRLGFLGLPGWRIGLEEILQHGQTYQIEQQGIFLTKYLSNGLSLELSGGVSKPRDDKDATYIGISFAKML